jgi:hypothetical protein
MSTTQSVVSKLGENFPLLGAALCHHRTTRGKPLTFKDKPYLIELYCDAPRIDGFDGMKAVQVGWSELLIQLVLERAGNAGKIAAYVLPTYQLRDRFVQRRVHPPIEQVPYWHDMLPGGDLGSIRIKRFGKGSLLFLGSNTVNDFIEFSADVLIVDEYDRCVQSNLALARDRLRASPNPQMYRIGNPTRPQYGVAALYDASDGRKWFHKCEHCGERQHLDWLVHFVDRDTSGKWVLKDTKHAAGGHLRPVCRQCGKPFDRLSTGGEWVAERPTNPRRGYNMSRLDVLSQEIRPLWHEWLEAQGSSAKLSAFYTSVLGKPYTAEGSGVISKDLADAATANPMDESGHRDLEYETVVAGIDVGSRSLHINISTVRKTQDDANQRIGRFVGTVSSFEEAYDMLVRYSVAVCVIDSRPEIRKAQELRDKCQDSGVCDLWLCQFHPTERVGKEDYGTRLDWGRRLVTVDRTQLLDATMDDLRYDEPRKLFPEDVWHVEGWQDQMTAPRRILNQRGEKYIWDEGNADDHYRFADAYERVALDLIQKSGTYLVTDPD